MNTTETTPRSTPGAAARCARSSPSLAITFGLAIALAVGLPHAGLNVPATALLPTISVAILTFTMFRRGTRREPLAQCRPREVRCTHLAVGLRRAAAALRWRLR